MIINSASTRSPQTHPSPTDATLFPLLVFNLLSLVCSHVLLGGCPFPGGWSAYLKEDRVSPNSCYLSELLSSASPPTLGLCVRSVSPGQQAGLLHV